MIHSTKSSQQSSAMYAKKMHIARGKWSAVGDSFYNLDEFITGISRISP